ncbi:molybdopterin guanine dinucleotide-containing S/N-oxide reductase [Microvirga sp. HBU67558]|uniref:molybdopterin guanine dinucleotide-containing S/N-oxide reductase n=1 Tax=Microvirga TaxID=186650 RepID=UPI001B380289|nr:MULTISPECIES: molybdopterin guanine dinucleotide-containing S/N-oxide reductase [unclassified Microvirga]MBQ0821238.1 molybdopterin guanine dinucleotide-containing S/N-oxide reductase [Microvirga sp. HBU67558]
MLPSPDKPTLATHWGTYRVQLEEGVPVLLAPYEGDPDPSLIANAMIAARTSPARVLRPAVRRSFLKNGAATGGEGRGAEPFVEVSWDDALGLVARELDRVRQDHGNQAIYGGSYGWASAGRFHHAQSQIHRFLNTIGGYTRSVQNYSFAAADTILPHVIGDRRGLAAGHTPWRLLAGHSDLIVMFGGASHKNAQVSSGGLSRHTLREGLRACRDAGPQLISISPIRNDTHVELGAEWWAPRPNSDVALMLGLCHTLLSESLHDRAFLARYTTGFAQVEAYLTGDEDGVAKTAEWAASLCEIPANEIRTLARRMAAGRTFIMMSWSLQRADHGEQPYWMAITLAAMLGQIGLPGGGFGFGYGSVNGVGNADHELPWPSLPQGTNAVDDFIPVARIADMLLSPGESFDFNGARRVYPDIRLVYWAGGNPFHHHQDLNRLVLAWKRPETIIVHEPWWTSTARHADIVLPVTTQLERNDIVCANRDRMLAASHRLTEPAGEARDDFAIFSALASRLGAEEAFTEGRIEESWLRHLYGLARQRIAAADMEVPDFDAFWREGVTLLPEPVAVKPLLADFRADPAQFPLATPSGLIELYSERIASFGYVDCPGHAAWLQPQEWLGAPAADRFPLHLISNQPVTKLHSQYDHGSHARIAKINGREPIRMNPQDAGRRGLSEGDIVRVFNDRGACLAGVCVSDEVRPGVVQLSTGAWFDPLEPGTPGSLDKHGNPNVLTPDRGTSALAQGPSAHSCLVEVQIYDGSLPPVTSHQPPPILRGS